MSRVGRNGEFVILFLYSSHSYIHPQLKESMNEDETEEEETEMDEDDVGEDDDCENFSVHDVDEGLKISSGEHLEVNRPVRSASSSSD